MTMRTMRKEGDPPPSGSLPEGWGSNNGIATLVNIIEDRLDPACWSASQLESSAKKLSDMYLAAMTLDSPTVTLDSEALAGIVNDLQTHSRILNRDLQRTMYKAEVEYQRATAVVAQVPFRTPTQSRTDVTTETLQEEIDKIQNLQGMPLPKDVWPQPAQLAVPSVPWWKRTLQFLGFFRPKQEKEVNISTESHPHGHPGRR